MRRFYSHTDVFSLGGFSRKALSTLLLPFSRRVGSHTAGLNVF